MNSFTINKTLLEYVFLLARQCLFFSPTLAVGSQPSGAIVKHHCLVKHPLSYFASHANWATSNHAPQSNS